MATVIALLRGINIGPNNRVAMADLREWLDDLGYENVRTHVNSGNVLVDTSASPASVGTVIEGLLDEYLGLDIAVVVRTAKQLATVVAADPHAAVAADPKRSFVAFCSKAPSAAVIAKVAGEDFGDERFVALGRELYAWCPGGMQDSRVMRALTDKRLGVTVTVRNWNTVTKLHALVGP